jgi:hypothetical protein
MTAELEKILFDLSKQMTREVYDLNSTRKKYHEGILAKEDIKSFLEALGKRQNEVHDKLREIMKMIC